MWNSQLLEMVPVPTIVADDYFFQAIFHANTTCVLYQVKNLLKNDYVENSDCSNKV